MRRLFVISDLHLGGRPDERNEAGHLARTGWQLCHGLGGSFPTDWAAAFSGIRNSLLEYGDPQAT